MTGLPRGRLRLVASVALTTSLLALSGGQANAAPGDLDPTFDSDGKWTMDQGGADRGHALLVQPNGKLVIVGTGTPDDAITVTRLNPAGSLDTSFSGDGTVAIGVAGVDRGNAAALQPDGKIVVAGKAGNDAAVVRLNADGSPDSSFDEDGSRTLDFGGDDSANAVLVQRNGYIVVAGSGGAGSDVTVARLTPTGALDPGFNGGSPVVTNLGDTDVAFALGQQPGDGGILVAGSTGLLTHDAFVMRLTLDGIPDVAFNETGVRILPADGDDLARALLVQPDGKVLLAGDGNPSTDVTAWRMDSQGDGDPGLDGDGIVEVDFGEFDYGYAAALQANGKIVVAGYTTVGGNLLGDFALIRLQPGGSLDTTFSLDGKQTVNVHADDAAYALALQRDGKIVAAGEAAGDLAVVRLQGEAGPGGGPPRGPADPRGPGGSSVPRCAGRRATIVGTRRRDVLRGTRRADVIASLGGKDRIRAGAGADLVCAGDGNDRVLGGPDGDRLFGQAGRDRLRGGPGKDRLVGGRARDRCRGGPGRDRVDCERPRGPRRRT